MNELLKFVIQYFSFLYYDCGARFVDSEVRNGDAFLVFELPDVRMRFVRDRAQVFLDFQRRHPLQIHEWFSFDIVRQLVTGRVDDNGIMWGTIDGDESTDHLQAMTNADFIKSKIPAIEQAFSTESVTSTEKTLREYAEARADRLFG